GGFSPRWEGYCILRSIALSSFLATASQPQKLLVLYSGAKQGGGFAFWVSVDSIRRMTPEELFTAALGLGRQWRVAECRFEGEPKRLELRLEHVPGVVFCEVLLVVGQASGQTRRRTPLKARIAAARRCILIKRAIF